MKTGLVTDPLFRRHDTGPGHPERIARHDAVLDGLEGLPLTPIEPRDATRPELAAAHTNAYIDAVKQRIEEGATHLDGDTAVCADSYAAATRAAGAALALGEALLDGRIEAGFAAVRPPGHHATPNQAMGFCLFNNIAVLARYLQAHGRRVAIVDWDVHHGNGTQDIFWNDPAVRYCSLHQSPLYPGTGAAQETGADNDGHILNIPLPAGSDGDTYRQAFEEGVIPWLKRTDGDASGIPDILLVSAGFDAHQDDPLAQMNLTANDFAEFTRMLLALSRPTLSLLEGGYDLDGLRDSARAHVEVLLEA